MTTDVTTEAVPLRPAKLLEGVRVLAFAHWLQGPAACQYLADLGADVVKVEPLNGSAERSVMGPGPGPEGASSLFVSGNRNMRSISLDLKSDAGRELVLRLVAEYDVVIENYRPGVLDRLGVGYDDLSKVNPGLIFASATGYGPRGPLAKTPGQDLLAQSLSGLVAATGATPSPAGGAIVDQHGASLLALAVLAAVVRRSSTGEGTKIEASLLNAALDLQMEALTFFLNSGMSWGQAATRDAHLGTWYHRAPYGVYETVDGHVSVSISDLALFAAAFPEIGDLSGLDALADRDEIASRLAAVLLPMSSADVRARLDGEGIWNAPVLNYDDVVASEQVALNSVIGEVGDDDWTARVVHHPVMYDGALPDVRLSPPRVGEHTDQVLLDLGIESDEIDALRAQGVLREDDK